MDDIILKLLNVSYSYEDGTKALDNVSLDIKRGRKIAVLGSNGAGKSTLFLILNGVFKPKKGTLFYHGDAVKYTEKALNNLRMGVGYVFQDPDSQLFAATVYQEVSFGPMNLDLSLPEVKKRVQNALSLTGVENLKERHTQFLSYGQKKSVSIADVLAMESEVVLFDEPTDSLDPRQKDRIEELFKNLYGEGKTILVSTHDIDFAWSWADEVLVLNKGKIVRNGRPEDIFNDEDLLYSADLVKPVVLSVYQKLIEAELVSPYSDPPRNREDLLALVGSLSVKLEKRSI